MGFVPGVLGVANGLRRRLGDSRANAATNCHARPHAGTDATFYTHANSYSRTDTGAYAHTYADSPSDANFDTGTDSHSNANRHSNTNTSSDTYANANAHSHTYAQPSGTGRCESGRDAFLVSGTRGGR